MTDHAQIIQLRPDADAGPVKTRKTSTKTAYCRHRQTELDMQARRVYCRDCGAEVPAFDFLVTLAGDYETYVNSRNEAKRQAEVAHDRLQDVERKIANARSRLKRALVKRAAELPNDWWRAFDESMQRGLSRPGLPAEAIERISLIYAESKFPGGRDSST